MSLWINNADVDGPGVRALVIGVSDYQYLPAENQFPERGRETLNLNKVDIPATGAFRFARWLRDSYWHPTHRLKSIRLLLSPSPYELAPTKTTDPALDADGLAELKAASQAMRATTPNVRAALLAWQSECRNHPEDMAVLYIAGHGIQWGDPDDAIVLLEDFSQDALFLNYAVGINATVRGMRGPDMPQIQLYFVDSCRINPDEYGKFDNAGTPLGLPSKVGVVHLGSAPIFYAACSQTLAKGRRGRGTYFAEALLDCLDTVGLQSPEPESTLVNARKHWHTNVASLTGPLSDRVRSIAGADQQEQHIAPGGTPQPAVFSAREQAPKVKIIVDVDPDEAAKVAHAQLWNHDQSIEHIPKTPCWERPLELTMPPASYLLQLSAEPPYKSQRFIVVDALPPRWPPSNNAIKLL